MTSDLDPQYREARERGMVVIRSEKPPGRGRNRYRGGGAKRGGTSQDNSPSQARVSDATESDSAASVVSDSESRECTQPSAPAEDGSREC